MNVPIKDLHEFKDNPYKIREDEDMEELIESIRKNGVLEPLIVRKREEGGYEVLSGNRRLYACAKLGIKEIPVSVRDLDLDSAIITLVDSNLKRENILPSERARAYKMKLDAERHQGTCGHDVLKSRDKVAEGVYSGRQVSRYIRLNELLPELLEKVDNGEIALSPAVEISYLNDIEQQDLLNAMEVNDCTPSHAQAIRLKELSKKGMLDDEVIFNILSEEKPNQRPKIQFKVDDLRKYFPKNYTEDQMYATIKKLLEKYQRNWQKNRDDMSR